MCRNRQLWITFVPTLFALQTALERPALSSERGPDSPFRAISGQKLDEVELARRPLGVPEGRLRDGAMAFGRLNCGGDLLEIKAESFGFRLKTQRRVQAMGTVSGVAFVG